MLTSEESELCKEIVDCAYKVHTRLGPGLTEKLYETCFCYELDKKGIDFYRQAGLKVVYDNIEFDEGFRADVLVNNRVICELKAVEIVIPLWKAQLMTYLKITGLSVGFIINFNVALIKNGIKRYTKEKHHSPP